MIPTPPPSPAELNQIIAYHEAGHAVMARLLGRIVYHMGFAANVLDSFNARTTWNQDSPIQNWDPNIPFERLQLRQQPPDNLAIFILAAGKAAEHVYYRSLGIDEAHASFGDGDERLIENAFRHELHLPEDQFARGKANFVNTAIRLLSDLACWQAVEALAQVILNLMAANPDGFALDEDEVMGIIAQAFQAA